MSAAKDNFLQEDEQEDHKGLKGLSDIRSLFFIFRYSRGHMPGLVIALFFIFISSLMAIWSTRYIGIMVEDVFIPKSWDKAVYPISMILGLEGFAMLIHWQGRRLLARHASYTLLNVREALLNHLCILPMSFYDHQPQGRIVTRLTHDVEGLEEFFTASLGRLINAVFVGTTATYAIFFSNWKIGAIIVLSMIPALIFIFSTRENIRSLNRRISKHSGQINAQLSEFINGIEVIRSLGLEDWSQKIFKEKVDAQEKTLMESNLYYAWTRPIVAFLCTFPLVTLVWFGGKMVLAHTLAVGLFVAIIRYTERFANPVLIIAWEVHIIQKAFANAERLSLFLAHKTENEIFDGDGHIRTGPLEGKIDFRHVKMSYGLNQTALNDVSFSIRKGEKIGFVGRTGSGKTTTVGVLARLYPFQSGELLIDDRPIQEYQRDFLRSQIGYIGQDVIIFHGTLRENLDFSKRFNDADLTVAMEMTGLAQTIKCRDALLDFEVLENGNNLSVGQKQLLSITRILLLGPSILIMDEATANVDPEMEHLVHRAVHKVMIGRTCLLIAHRLNTLSECDRILVFKNGQVVEEGPPSVLANRPGAFQELAQAALLPTVI